MIPIVLFIMIGLIPISFSPIGRALARRIGGESEGRQDAADIEALQGEVAQLQQQLDEVQNRLDFAERLLAQARERGLLSDGKDK